MIHSFSQFTLGIIKNQLSFLSTIRAKRISDLAHLDLELEHFVKVFKSNGYDDLIRKTIKKYLEKKRSRCTSVLIHTTTKLRALFS